MGNDEFRERLIAALERIAVALEPSADEEAAPEPGCLHPPDERIDFGTTDGQPDWMCKVCRFRPTEATS